MKITYAYIEENLFNLGQSADGHAIDGLRYTVVVKTANGRRFAHSFDVQQSLEWDEDVHTIVQWDDADMEKLDALKERVNKAGSINPDNGHWVEIEPQYGTKAWLDYEVSENSFYAA
jgi:hypothetical protein